MAAQRSRENDGEPGGLGRGALGPHDSGTRRILRNDEPHTAPADPLADPWATDDPPSLLSVASWLVDSVRGIPDSSRPGAPPTITIAEADLTLEELAAVHADLRSDTDARVAPPPLPVRPAVPALPAAPSTHVEIGQAVLSPDEVEAVDEFDLAPLRHSFERGDHVTLLAAAEALLELRPSMGAAVPYLTAARETLRRRYMMELGGQQEVPRVLRPVQASDALQRQEVQLLGLIDGTSTLEEIVDRSELPQVSALRIVDRLCAIGLVGCGARYASYC